MMSSHLTLAGMLVAALAFPIVRAGEEHDHAHHDHDHGIVETERACFDLTTGWFAPWEHEHFRNGVPLIHNFGLEPAFLGRELFADYVYASLEEGEEHEIELELEWALTRRIGMVLEQGYVFESPDGEADVDGWGDFAVVPRFVLADCDRCIISANLEVVAPTGSDEIGAGEEWRLAPFLTTWCDLGNWWSLTTQSGLEFALDSDETEFFFGVGLAKALRIFEPAGGPDDHGHGHEVPLGILSVLAELTGDAVVDGDPGEEGVFSLNGLVGVNYGTTSTWDVRAGYLFPLNAHSELEGGLTLGFIRRF